MLLDRIPYHRTRISGPQDTTLAPARIFGRTVRKLRSYINIPAFSIPNVWRGASEIVYRFDFPIGLMTLLEKFPITPPENANFCPVVSWRVGDEFIRYKLWENVGEILWLPLYNKEKIPTDEFHIEIWNVYPRILVEFEEDPNELVEHEGEDTIVEFDIAPGEAITTLLEEAITINTSRLTIPSNLCDETDINLGAPTTCVDPIYHLENFQPIYGDHYLLVAPCERQLIKFTQVVAVNYLKNRDDNTWHRVWAQFTDGNMFLFIDPTNEVPPVGALGYFPLISRTDHLTYKMELENGPDGTGNYTVIDTQISASALSVDNVLLQDTDTFTNTILWALYITSNGAGGQRYEFITGNSFNGGIT